MAILLAETVLPHPECTLQQTHAGTQVAFRRLQGQVVPSASDKTGHTVNRTSRCPHVTAKLLLRPITQYAWRIQPYSSHASYGVFQYETSTQSACWWRIIYPRTAVAGRRLLGSVPAVDHMVHRYPILVPSVLILHLNQRIESRRNNTYVTPKRPRHTRWNRSLKDQVIF